MRIGALIADKAGCGLYRIAIPAAVTKPLGVDVDILKSLPARVQDGEVIGVGEIPYDVVIYQRPLLGQLVDTIPFVQARGVKVVVELDDDLEATHPQNSAYLAVSPRHDKRSNWAHLRRAVTMADVVTCSTQSLARHYGGSKAIVVPNFVLRTLLDVTRPEEQSDRDDRARVGWTGQISSHPLDLQVTCGGVAQAAVENDAVFRVIGDGGGVAHALRMTEGAFEYTGWVPLEKYPHAVATLDVGVVPLDDTRFNQGKSALKGTEMAAVGVPFVCTPTEDYRRVLSLGLGVSASNRTEWYEQTSKLIRDMGYRKELSDRGRVAVSEHLTAEANAHRWVEAWERALVEGSSRAAAATA